MDLKQALIIILSGMVGTLGFAFLFRMTKKRIGWAVVGGALTCIVYVICVYFFGHEFFQNVFPALAATLFSEVLARLTKSPATPFLACSIITLVPGGKLYYTMYYFIVSDMENFHTTLISLLRIVAGLAVGIIIISVIIHQINYNKFKQIYDME